MSAPSEPHQGTDGSQRPDLQDAPASGQAAAGGQERGLQATITAEVAAEVERFIGKGSLDDFDFEAVETAARQMALRVAGQAIAQRLKRRSLGRAGPPAPLRLWRRGPLRQPPTQDLHHRPRVHDH